MPSIVEETLRAVGLEPAKAAELSQLVSNPPPGMFDPSELHAASEARIALLATIVAAARRQQFNDVLEPLLRFVAAHATQLNAYDIARFSHIRGMHLWRSQASICAATQSFNSSIDLLETIGTDEASRYVPRVMDTYGQFLSAQGLMYDARKEFESALVYREALHDDVGMAITLGNLGRLCMDMGDFNAAAQYLERDLHIVESSPDPIIAIQIQLLSHLGTCHFELGNFSESRALFTRTNELAENQKDWVGLSYAALGLGRIALKTEDSAEAKNQLNTAQKCVQEAALGGYMADSLSALLHQFAGAIDQKNGDFKSALEEYQLAQKSLERVPHTSPITIAQLLRDHAEVALATENVEEATALLRNALNVLDSTAADSMRQSIEDKLHALSRDSWLLHAAGRFVGQDQIELLLSEAGQGGFRGANENVAILFSDIRDFTTISEQFTPEELVLFLNDYLGHMTRCVQQFGGLVDKFIGDAVMAIFSLPESRADDAERSVMAAMLMRAELERFNRMMPDGTPKLSVGIGLHYGAVVAGLIGSPQKRSYTVIGDTVNTGSRLEGMTKMLGASILLSGELVEQLPNPQKFLMRPLGRYLPKGRNTPVAVYELVGEDDGSDLLNETREEIAEIQQALHIFERGDFKESSAAFQRLAEKASGTHRERGYLLLMKEALSMMESPAPASWDGVIVLTDK